jgi:hypothetical protein
VWFRRKVRQPCPPRGPAGHAPLASSDAAWITGIVLDVAGGATMVR